MSHLLVESTLTAREDVECQRRNGCSRCDPSRDDLPIHVSWSNRMLSSKQAEPAPGKLQALMCPRIVGVTLLDWLLRGGCSGGASHTRSGPTCGIPKPSTPPTSLPPPWKPSSSSPPACCYSTHQTQLGPTRHPHTPLKSEARKKALRVLAGSVAAPGRHDDGLEIIDQPSRLGAVDVVFDVEDQVGVVSMQHHDSPRHQSRKALAVSLPRRV